MRELWSMSHPDQTLLTTNCPGNLNWCRLKGWVENKKTIVNEQVKGARFMLESILLAGVVGTVFVCMKRA